MFTEYGYEKASTNKIVKEAGIGKGMLFYYFNSKQELYEDLLYYGMDLVTKEYLEKIDEGECDLIEKYRQASIIKMKSYHKFPYAYDFFGKIYIDPKAQEKHVSKDALDYMYRVREIGFAKLFKNIDTSKFRKDIPADKVMKMIIWCMEGYERELMTGLKETDWIHLDVEPLLKAFYNYLEILKKTFYQEEDK